MSTDPEQVIVYVTNRQWESKVSLGAPYLEHPWQQRILNDTNPHHWAYRTFIAYKSPAPNLSRVDFNMTTFYTPKERTDKHTIYWVCSRIVDNHVTWWIVTPNSSEYQKVAPSPRHKEFYGWTIQEEFYAVAHCQKCLWQNTKTQLECENCKIKGREERRPELPPKPTGPPAIGAKPSLGTDEVSVLITNRKWESRAALEKPFLKEYSLGFEDGNQHHWAFKAFKAWKTAAPGRIKVTIDKVEFYAYEEEASTENPHEGVLYYACQKPDHPKSWWIFCPTSADRAQYQKDGNLYTWKPVFQFYAKPDRESEAYFQEKEDRRRWQCEDCNHINPGYRMECEFCYESRLKESKQGIEVRRFGERAKSPTSDPTPSTSTPSSSSYVLSPPKKYTLPFQPGTPSKLSLLDLIKTKEKCWSSSQKN